MVNRYVSEELFHFVGRSGPNKNECNWNVLEKVLNNGCVSHFPHNVDWGGKGLTADFKKSLANGELIEPQITCYCDVPFDSLRIHCEKYGRFGLSLHRKLLIKHGARPVTYVPMTHEDQEPSSGRQLLEEIQLHFHKLHNHVAFDPELNKIREQGTTRGQPPNNLNEAICAIDRILVKDVLAFIKPFDSTLPDNHRDNYYMEREWRKFGNMLFKPGDIIRVVVAKGYKQRVQAEFPDLADKVSEI